MNVARGQRRPGGGKQIQTNEYRDGLKLQVMEDKVMLVSPSSCTQSVCFINLLAGEECAGRRARGKEALERPSGADIYFGLDR